MGKTIIISNRLPVQLQISNGSITAIPSVGGLATGMKSVHSGGDSLWIGWSGLTDEDIPKELEADIDKALAKHGSSKVTLSEAEVEGFYFGFSNRTIWPLFHYFLEYSEFELDSWNTYKTVNQKFADAILDKAEDDDVIWIHDYQLMLVPQMVREKRPNISIGFFLHIPFPSFEIFRTMPWRKEVLEGLLGADLIGFQTPEHADNFQRLAIRLGVATRQKKSVLKVGSRTVTLKAVPIGIDNARYDQASTDPDIIERAQDLRARLGQPHKVLLGVDRLDYTKGIDLRLRAYKELLAEGRLNPATVTMIQVAEPSRDKVDAYITLRERVERLVGEINGDFGRVGFPVVHYIHQSQTFEELMAMYRAADVMLVTPFNDGMNLVAKEYVATRYDETGALVLSEFAGAAVELKDALLVNPHDIDGVKGAIMEAVEMEPEESRDRMRKLRRVVRRNDAVAWAKAFLDELSSLNPAD